MITEDYVSFETAILLKEKGFNEKTYRCYNLCTEEHELSDVDDRAYNNWELADDGAVAPTLQMAMKWLREKHKITIGIVFKGDRIYYEIHQNNEFVFGVDTPKSYEEACDEATRYCLENLI